MIMDEKKTVIRPSCVSDTEKIREIVREQWGRIYSGYADIIGEELYSIAFRDALDKKTETIAEMALDSDHCFVALEDGQVCGFCCFDESGEVGILSNNAVADAYKGRGIASKLYSRAFEKMKERGCKAVRLQTGLDDAHISARRAYEKMGFEVGLPSITYYKKL